MTVLDVRLEQFPYPIGTLAETPEGNLAFQYSPEYLRDEAAYPISLSLPLGEVPYDDQRTRNFFQNLLPENDQLRDLIEKEGIDTGDIPKILSHVGADLSGALSCLPEGDPPVKNPGDLARDYEPLSEEKLAWIVDRLLAEQPIRAEVEEPSPVAGVQRKIALCLTEDGFAVPRPGTGAPTTHILKVPGPALAREAFYEARCADLAAGCGLEVASCESRWIAGIEVIISKRFDRQIRGGLVYRVHQEDFAQALGIPPKLKYEREARGQRRYDANAIAEVLRQTSIPALSVDAFLKATFFNLAVGNTDNHAKNHALIYDSGRVPRLAPLYDLVPIRISDRYNHLLAFYIGSAQEFKDITRADLLQFLGALGLAGSRAERFLAREIAPLLDRLKADSTVGGDWEARLTDLRRQSANTLLDLIAGPENRTDAPQASENGAAKDG